ncbi:amidase [Actinomadura sp. 7K507]|uniref:amidase n=1 Tax=Actinomadura sp. 7K507 TaxID=2530365 RepID=UPI00104556C2|nr:amidase [Actinomadura sp. 7K507]TDC97606.1 amidase [Actinomadura sp. 7K507]
MTDPYMDATGAAELVRTGQATPTELVEQAIERIEAVNPELNAVIVPLYEKARAEAARVPEDAPFAGVPYVLKDLTVHSEGDPYAAGCAGVKAAGYRSDHDSHFVTAMRDAGFVLIGKASTSEMGMYESTEPLAWGPTRNPWNTGRSAGGSSGGSAAAVAAGMVPVAHGNDGGGSVRSPSSQCGVVGLKPTRGRISSGPMVVESDTVCGMATEGVISRSVRDAAGMLDAVSGHRPGDGYYAPPPSRPFTAEVGADPGRLRIGILDIDPTGQIAIDPESVAATRAVADALAGLGHDVSDGYPDTLRQGMWPLEWFGCVGVVIAREFDWLGEQIGRPITEADVEPATWAYIEQGRKVDAITYAAGVDALRVQAREIERWWEEDGWDLLLAPTIPAATPKIGELGATADDPSASVAMAIMQNTVLFNVSGQPAISLPVYERSDGMPQGVQLAAAYGREDVLLRVGAQLEAAMPWADRRPPHGVR